MRTFTRDLRTMNLRDVLPALQAERLAMSTGEILEVRVADFAQAAQRWLDLPEAERWGEALQAIYGPQQGGGFYRSGYNAPTLHSLLTQAGFSTVTVETDGAELVAHGTR